jgi:predicted metalloendopeptidase
MKKSVDKYIFVDKENNKEYKMNAKLTMGENLADIGGLSLSMQALIENLKKNNASDLVINTSLRVFFKSWANVWKQNIKKDKRIMLLNVDPHAPTDFRGNLVQHMDEFYKVFSIKKTDKMYLESENRMKMW